MKISTSHALLLDDVFGLENIIDPNGRISRSEDRELYLFTCPGLLQEGQQIAIDEHQGTIGTYQDHTTLMGIRCNEMEISVLTALTLPFPYSVSQSQMQDLHTLYRRKQKDFEATNDPSDERFLPSELVAACNERLRHLDIAIVLNESAYQMIALRK